MWIVALEHGGFNAKTGADEHLPDPEDPIPLVGAGVVCQQEPHNCGSHKPWYISHGIGHCKYYPCNKIF